MTHTPGSFTKNFGWDESYLPLHSSIGRGFSLGRQPTTRDDWRNRSGIPGTDRQLVPMNFFLFSLQGIKHDYIMVDHFVDVALDRPYDDGFALLSLFTFHLAQSGRWRKTNWPDGRVAGWANELITDVSSTSGEWNAAAFHDDALRRFIASKIRAETETITKVFTNYRYMLRSADVVVDEVLRPANHRKVQWHLDAVQVFWDRQILSGSLPATATRAAFEDALRTFDIQKLLRCKEDQCLAFARAAWRTYSPERIANQLNELRRFGAVAA